ncbi:hypothetical protein [Halocalculus aciditolerans]|uniref:Uncharacterized protein n=1 Tax=Halocalculus aciditolerans TaxID=1383812 RepID=A0A830FMX6_9EURY|nr:hypothetical protein [Halocalculus aciditolerans]GGL71676.1 hypothetical protein GCM10009039_32170 [Halocalculus aciditolerans]
MDFASDQPPWVFYGIGAIIAIVGIAMFFIDQDPAILFESPVFTLLLILVGAGVGYLGWQNQQADSSTQSPTR